MNKRPVDKTKKSNIKCEHCKYWLWANIRKDKKVCTVNKPIEKATNYWNRCKQFEWKDKAESENP